MILVTVLGLDDGPCREVLRRVGAVVAESTRGVVVETGTDFDRMITQGAYVPPAVLVDGVLMSVGRVPSAAELRDWLSVPRYGEDSGIFQAMTYKKRLERAGK